MNHRNQKRIIISLSTICLVLAALPAHASPIDTTYWDRAVEIAEANHCLVPLTIIESETVSDPKGKLLQDNVTHLQVVKKGGDALDIKLVSRKENGEDATETFYKDFIANKQETVAELEEESLFAKCARHLITLTDLDLQGNRATYTFRMTVEGVEFSGRADIDTRSGHAVYTQVTTPLMAEDGVVISNYEEITHFKKDGDRWYPEKVIEHMEIELGNVFSSFEGRVHSETILADYFCNQ